MPYTEFPEFENASVGEVFNVTEPTSGHFFWPDLAVDLSIESIEFPERFLLVARTQD